MNLDNISREEKIVLLELFKERERRRLANYRPYPKQLAFHAAGLNHRERLFRAANQCAGPWTFIDCVGETGETKAPAVEVFFSPDARVYGLVDGYERVVQKAYGCLKGIERAYRIVTGRGRYVDVSANHRILTARGYERVDLIVSRANGLRLSHKAEDYEASCVEGGYLCGQQPRCPTSSALEQPPSSDDAQKCSLIFSSADAEEQIRQHKNLFEVCAPLPISDDVRQQIVDLCERFSRTRMADSVLALTDEHRDVLRFVSALARVETEHESVVFDSRESFRFRQDARYPGVANMPEQHGMTGKGDLLSHAVSCPLRSISELDQDADCIEIFYPFSHVPLIGGETIVSIVPIGYQPILDVHIPIGNNYRAAGMYHHNSGKSLAGAAEAAMHATGLYPDWWPGRRFENSTRGWISSVSNETARDTAQRLIIGGQGELGTGFVPERCIKEIVPSRGIANLADSIIVEHVTGGVSSIKLKSYEQGREKFQADTIDWAWNDEEPSQEIYTEILTRTNATGGIVWTTFTPLMGMSEVVRRFLTEKSQDRADINMTIDDAEHIGPEEKRRIIASYPAHELEARTRGTPMLGSGRIFPISESAIKVPRFEIPAWYRKIGGLDFGWDHPTAAARIAYNPDMDTIYVTSVYKRKEAIPAIHASALRAWGRDLPWAWPHDGLQHDKGSGEQLAEQYRREALNMLPERATFEDGTNGVEAGVTEILSRMENGTLKVFDELELFFEEFRLYHRKDGKIVKEYDDILDALRYAVMMIRFSQPDTVARHGAASHTFEYNPLSSDYILNN